MQQPTYRLPALVVAVLGLILAGCRVDPASSAVDPRGTVTPERPAPTAAQVSPTPTAEPTSDAAPEWATYTNNTYGFSFHYPVTWGLTELPAGREAAGGTASMEIRLMRDDLRLVIQVKSEDERYVLGPSGRGAGEIIDRESVSFLGHEIALKALVYEGKDKAVFWGDEIDQLIFYIQLDEAQMGDADYGATALPAQAQTEMVAILASFARTAEQVSDAPGEAGSVPDPDTEPPTEAGTTRERALDGMTMVYVPSGRFEMGATEEDAAAYKALCETYGSYGGNCTVGPYRAERPAHPVALDAYWIDQTEVTVAQYEACVDAGVCDPTPPVMERHGPVEVAPNHPATTVFWAQAQTYCEYVGGQLPTEAEWEYAARGPDSRRFPWGDRFVPENVNYCDARCDEMWGDAADYGASPADPAFDDGYAYMAPVGTYPEGASWCGALDMAGNVDEWTADWIGHYTIDEQDNPIGPQGEGEGKVVRGGSWRDFPVALRSTGRIVQFPESGGATTGFRCVVPAVLGGEQ